MRQRQVFLALHFLQARGGAFENRGTFAAAVQIVRHGGGGGVEFHSVLVQGVDQGDEAAGFVEIVGREAGNAVDQQGVVVGGQRQIVASTQGNAAQGAEIEPGDAVGGERDGEPAPGGNRGRRPAPGLRGAFSTGR